MGNWCDFFCNANKESDNKEIKIFKSSQNANSRNINSTTTEISEFKPLKSNQLETLKTEENNGKILLILYSNDENDKDKQFTQQFDLKINEYFSELKGIKAKADASKETLLDDITDYSGQLPCVKAYKNTEFLGISFGYDVEGLNALISRLLTNRVSQNLRNDGGLSGDKLRNSIDSITKIEDLEKLIDISLSEKLVLFVIFYKSDEESLNKINSYEVIFEQHQSSLKFMVIKCSLEHRNVYEHTFIGNIPNGMNFPIIQTFVNGKKYRLDPYPQTNESIKLLIEESIEQSKIQLENREIPNSTMEMSFEFKNPQILEIKTKELFDQMRNESELGAPFIIIFFKVNCEHSHAMCQLFDELSYSKPILKYGYANIEKIDYFDYAMESVLINEYPIILSFNFGPQLSELIHGNYPNDLISMIDNSINMAETKN